MKSLCFLSSAVVRTSLELLLLLVRRGTYRMINWRVVLLLLNFAHHDSLRRGSSMIVRNHRELALFDCLRTASNNRREDDLTVLQGARTCLPSLYCLSDHLELLLLLNCSFVVRDSSSGSHDGSHWSVRLMLHWPLCNDNWFAVIVSCLLDLGIANCRMASLRSCCDNRVMNDCGRALLDCQDEIVLRVWLKKRFLTKTTTDRVTKVTTMEVFVSRPICDWDTSASV